MQRLSLFTTFIVRLLLVTSAARAAPPLNVLLMTADDMNYDTPGFTGNRLPDITPNLDRLAREGLFIVNAHVAVAVCQPSRECLMTGRYPHHNGAVGFYPVRNDVPTLMELLKAAGYRIGILGKVEHLKPDEKFPWDFKREQAELGAGRDPARYGRFAREFLAQAKAAGKPFFLMANSHDPHRPWAGSEQERDRAAKGGKQGKQKAGKAKAGSDDELGGGTYPAPSRVYRPEEITVPDFLPNLPEVRTEMAQYYSSAHRCDESLGEVLRALEEAGLKETTLVMFLSDNGISMPFAKSNCYFSSTRTPWLVRWPGKVKPGSVDARNFISGIDFMPTILEATGVAAPADMDGRSFLPLLTGEARSGHDHVFTCYNESSGRNAYPMRCLQTRRFGYIYNAWSDGKTAYRSEAMNGATFPAMKEAAASNQDVAARVELLVHRVPEELYDFEKDPSALNNLANDPAHFEQLRKMRAQMRAWMEETADPLLADYRTKITDRGNSTGRP